MPPTDTYDDGRPYAPALPQGAELPRVHHLSTHLVIPLVREQPDPSDFIRRVVRELKIRNYARSTIAAYRGIIRRFLEWFGRRPHEVTVEDVRCYLEYLVDGGCGPSTVQGTLAALRLALDKFGGLSATLGLRTPRKKKRRPVILSRDEVHSILDAAASTRDTLLLGLMYGAGLRVGEVVRLRWSDVDFDRNTLRVHQSKGRKDRHTQLPESFRPLLLSLAELHPPDGPVFPGRRKGRHLSKRTAQRAMTRARKLAKVRKKATCHSLRHAFATHLCENGTDIRVVRDLLGHVRLETTCLYAHVAKRKPATVTSPLDDLPDETPEAPVGTLSFEVTREDPDTVRAAAVIAHEPTPVRLDGIRITEPRPGWVTLDIPPEEAWATSLRRLPAPQRQRIQAPAFYELLRTHLTDRYLALKRRE